MAGDVKVVKDNLALSVWQVLARGVEELIAA
jgi:hypothetical protein